MESKEKLKEYINKRRSLKEIKTVEIVTVRPPWYKRPLFENEFVVKTGRNKKLYIRHNEWSKNIFIGPYNNLDETSEIIKSYIDASLEINLNKKLDSRVSSIRIEHPEDFFIC
jgi:hypothetical protein